MFSKISIPFDAIEEESSESAVDNGLSKVGIDSAEIASEMKQWGVKLPD